MTTTGIERPEGAQGARHRSWPGVLAGVGLLPVAFGWGFVTNYLPVVSPVARAYADGQPTGRLVVVPNPDSSTPTLVHAALLVLLIAAAGWPPRRRRSWPQAAAGVGVAVAGWCGVVFGLGLFFFGHHKSCVHADCAPQGLQEGWQFAPLALTSVLMLAAGLLGGRVPRWVRVLVPPVGFVVAVLLHRYLWLHWLLDDLSVA